MPDSRSCSTTTRRQRELLVNDCLVGETFVQADLPLPRPENCSRWYPLWAGLQPSVLRSLPIASGRLEAFAVRDSGRSVDTRHRPPYADLGSIVNSLPVESQSGLRGTMPIVVVRMQVLAGR